LLDSAVQQDPSTLCQAELGAHRKQSRDPGVLRDVTSHQRGPGELDSTDLAPDHEGLQAPGTVGVVGQVQGRAEPTRLGQ
jgi:hypothetical protein